MPSRPAVMIYSAIAAAALYACESSSRFYPGNRGTAGHTLNVTIGHLLVGTPPVARNFVGFSIEIGRQLLPLDFSHTD